MWNSRAGASLVMVLALVACGGEGATAPGARDPGVPEVALALGQDSATGATLETDKDDYLPGEIVHLRGAGWAPGESIRLEMSESPDTHGDVDTTVVADAQGAFTLHFYDVQPHDLGVTFTLVGTGATSGSRVTVVFTDGRAISSVTLNGQASVMVAPLTPIAAVVNGALTGNAQNTLGAIGVRAYLASASPSTATSLTCFNVADLGPSTPSNSIPFSVTFPFNAPSQAGAFNLIFTSYSDDACAVTAGSSDFTVFNGVITSGSITIFKDAVPDDAQDFAFSVSGGNGLTNFSLDDDADPTLPNTRAFSTIPPGTYTVTEVGLPGWSLTSLVCTGGGANTTVNLATRTSSITLEAGETVVCTYTNTKQAVNQNPTVQAAASDASGNEGSALAASGSFADPDGDALTITGAGAGTVTDNGNGTWSWSYTPADNGSGSVIVTASDGKGGTVTDTFDWTAQNVAPTATFSNNGPVNEGTAFTLSLTGAQDASSVDQASLTFAFDCGSGYGAAGSASSASCPTDDNGTRSVKGRVIDKDGGATEYTASVTINNVAPTVTGVTAPPSVLEGAVISFSVNGVTDPSSVDEAAGFTYAYSCDDGASYGSYSPSASSTCPAPDGPATITVAVKARDKDGAESVKATASVTVDNVAPTLASLTGTIAPTTINTNVSVTPTFTDPAGSNDTYTAWVNWDDGNGFVTAGAATSGTPITRTFAQAGVYTVCAYIKDEDGGQSGTLCYEYIVVYDPSAGFVTGGGWITSPVNAYPANPALTGKATFGFVSKYQKGASKPSGNTEFQFHAGGFDFKSTSYDWLVVAGSLGQYKGQGTVNGVAGYGFLLTATDGQATGGGGTDKFRIKVWNLATSAVVYDNQMNQPEDGTSGTALGGGSIVIHTK